MIFMGPLYQREQEAEIRRHTRIHGSGAANSFQWNIIDGLCENLGQGIRVINVLPIGAWPKYDTRLVLPDRCWELRGQACHEVGCINVPVLKQLARFWKTRKLLRGLRNEEVLLCTAYMPFLWALRDMERSNKLTLIVTDLPEYADMHRVSKPRQWLRKVNNRLVYRFMERVDGFVLLTEQMKGPLRVGDRPYIVMEGICSIPAEAPEAAERRRAILYSGRLNGRYGIQNLLDAFSMLEDDSLELWICGSGEMEQTIRDAAKRDGRIRFFGFCSREKVLAMQRTAAVLVNPRQNREDYTKYSFPSKTMEYLASGTPVVMHRLEGIPESYDKYLHYVGGNSPSELADTLKKVLDADPVELERKAREARKYIHTEKNPAVQAGKILTMMRHL